MTLDTLSGAQRAAVLVVALGVETASQFLPELSDDEVERVSVEVARLRRVPGPVVAGVLQAYHAAAAQPVGPADAEGGLDTARTFLRESLDEARAGTILPRVEAVTEGTGFDLAQAAPADALAAFLGAEHPQTAAVVLARLPARHAADVLGHLDAAIRGDVVRRLSLLGAPSPDALRDLDTALRLRFGATAPAASNSGVKRAADILTQAGRATGRSVLDALQAGTPDLAEQIESLLFVFEDLARLHARALGRILSDADPATLALALRGADAGLEARVFSCISERVGAAVREEMEMGAEARPQDIEEAQRAVVGIALALAESGQVSLEPTDVTADAPVATPA